jgi:hypothetical protein
VGDVSDQLDGIVDDLFCVVDVLELSGFIEVDQVFIEVETCGGEQWAGIIVKVGGDALTFFLLQADGGIEQHFLLVLLHFLQLQLVTDHFALVENDENDEADG